MHKSKLSLLVFAVAIFLLSADAYCQSKYIPIKLPAAISSINEEFSGLATYNKRVYFLPQYGGHKPTMTNGAFNIYSISTDSINRVITGADTALTAYRIIKVLNLNKLPAAVKKYYQGFESITIVNNRVYLSVETVDSTTTKCYLLKGILNVAKGQLVIDPYHYVTLKRPLFIKNAGFEGVTYLPKQNKLLAMYEFNASAGGGTGYLIDPAFKKPVQSIKTPFLYFRITDLAAQGNGRIYGINYYWGGDYDYYLNNKTVTAPEEQIKQAVPNLRDSLIKTPAYLKNKATTYARIVTLKNYKATQWQQIVGFDGYKNNWEGITLFKKGALIVSDANINKLQVTTLAYIEF